MVNLLTSNNLALPNWSSSLHGCMACPWLPRSPASPPVSSPWLARRFAPHQPRWEKTAGNESPWAAAAGNFGLYLDRWVRISFNLAILWSSKRG